MNLVKNNNATDNKAVEQKNSVEQPKKIVVEAKPKAAETKAVEHSLTVEKPTQAESTKAASTPETAPETTAVEDGSNKVPRKSFKKIVDVFKELNLRNKFAGFKIRLSGAKNFYKTLDRKKKFVLIGASSGVLVVVLVGGFFCFHHSSTPQYTYNLSVAEEGGNPEVPVRGQSQDAKAVVQDPVLVKLNNLEHQMAVIQKQQHQDNVSTQALKELNENVASLKQSVATLSGGSPDSVAQIQTLVVQSNQALSGQLSSIQKTVDTLKQRSAPKHYLPASTLPWAIQGIDVRNYQPVVVRANGFDAMQRGDVRDGWKLIDVHFDPAGALFQNVDKPNDYVRIQ